MVIRSFLKFISEEDEIHYQKEPVDMDAFDFTVMRYHSWVQASDHLKSFATV